MICPKCKSEDVNVSTEQIAGKTKTNNVSFLWKLGRLCMIICTAGFWLLVGKKKENGSTKFKSQTVAICQGCGHKWKI